MKFLTKDYLKKQFINFEQVIISHFYIQKEDGKGLSSNDYTNDEKSKLAKLENYNDSELINKISSLTSSLDTKVDKVSGKELSSNDYTDTEKTKLANLSNYDDTEVLSNISSLQKDLSDTKTNLETVSNGLMKSISYENKKLTILFKNGTSYDIDLSSIINDTNIEELKNVSTDIAVNNQVLGYDTSSNKWKPINIDLSKCLQDAKDYTDTCLSSLNKADAISCDSEPTLSENTITYYQNKEKKTKEITNNADTWFFYSDGDTVYQTVFVDGVKFTVKNDNSINIADYVKKSSITSSYPETDTAKICNISSINMLYNTISAALGKKINTSDIVDNLLSESVDIPLSANQGRILNNNKQDILTAGNNITITNNKISAKDTTYSAGTNVSISEKNEISADISLTSDELDIIFN